MDVSSANVDELVRAYQDTVGRAEALPALERLIVVSAISDHSTAAAHTLDVAVPGGDRVSTPIAAFSSKLQKDDVLGSFRGLVGSWAKKTTSAVWKDVLKGHRFLIAAAAFGDLAVFAGWVRSAGAALGSAVAVIVLGLIALAQRNPGQLFQFLRTAGGALGGVHPRPGDLSIAGVGLGDALTGKIGVQAEQMLNASTWPTADRILPAVHEGKGTPKMVRSAAMATAWIIVVAVGISALIFAAGLASGFSDGFKPQPNSPCVASILVSCP